MDWTADEIILTIDAWHRIQKNPSQRDIIEKELAQELGRNAVDASIRAVEKDDLRSNMLRLLVGALPSNDLFKDPAWAQREAKKVRDRVLRLKSMP